MLIYGESRIFTFDLIIYLEISWTCYLILYDGLLFYFVFILFFFFYLEPMIKVLKF